MYDELVKDLRENHDKYFARDMQAADAIETLLSCLQNASNCSSVGVENKMPLG